MKNQKIAPKGVMNAFQFIIPPFAMLILGKVLFELLAFKFPELNISLIEDFSQNNATISFQETKARLQWLTSVLLYFFVNAVFLTFIFNIFWRSISQSALWIFILAAFFYSASEIIYFSLIDSAKSPMASIFRFTFESLKASAQYTEYQLNHIYITTMLINLLAILVVPLGIMAGGCIMYNQIAASNSDLNSLLSQSKHIKDLLVGGSSVMVIGIAHMQLWLNWPLSFLPDDTMRHQIEAITFAVSQYWGVIYTLTMAALYFPAAITLSANAKKLIATGSDEQTKRNPELWLAENKMLLSPYAQLPQLVALIAPMLIGSFGTTLGHLMPF